MTKKESSDEYQQLPEVIKTYLTEKEYQYLGDQQRRTLIEDMTCPEPEDE